MSLLPVFAHDVPPEAVVLDAAMAHLQHGLLLVAVMCSYKVLNIIEVVITNQAYLEPVHHCAWFVVC